MATGIQLVELDGSNTTVTGYSQNATLTVPIDLPVTDNDGPITNRAIIIAYNVYKSGGGNPTITLTIDGVTRIPTTTNAVTTGNTSWAGYVAYIDDDLLPAGPGTYNIVLSTTYGNTYGFGMAAGVFKNVFQLGPGGSDSGTTTTGGTSVSNALDHPAGPFGPADGYVTAHATTHSVGTADWLHNNAQQEIHTIPGAGFNTNVALTYITSNASIASTFTSISATSGNLTKPGFNFSPIIDYNVYFRAAVDATSTVVPKLNRTKFVTTTLSTTIVSAGELLRDRGYVTTVPAVTTVTPVLVTNRKISSQTTADSTVTVQAFNRTARLAAEIMIEPVVSGIFSVTRPLAVGIDAQSTVTAQFGSNFQETQYSPTPGDYVELYEIDTTVIGGADVFRFVPHRFETPDLQVEWKGNTFIQFPVEAEGFETQATGTAPPQPTLRVSNVNKFILAAVLELGDIVGAKVTRWRTYARFLDNGETPDPTAHYAPDVYFIQQKTAHTREFFEFSLSSALDLPGIKLPRRQVLKDQSSDERNLYAPGAANVRFRGR